MTEAGEEIEHAVAEQMAPDLSRFMGTIAGTTTFELGELAADEVRFLRFKRSVKHAQKAKAILDDAGIKPQAVPFRTLVPLLEKASLEDDDSLIDRWAALLANAAGGQLDVPPSFPNVLHELEPVQAAILDYVYDGLIIVAPKLRRTTAIGRERLVLDFKLTEDQAIYHTDNLVRLRLLGPGSDHVGEETRRVTLTEFGRAFVRACRHPSRPDPPVVHTDPARLAEQIGRNQEALDGQRATARVPPDDLT